LRERFVPSQLIVRPVAPTDLDQWESLWEGYNRFYRGMVPAEVTRMTWSRFFDAYEPVHGIVAEKNGGSSGWFIVSSTATPR
jgi:hypothetical protein